MVKGVAYCKCRQCGEEFKREKTCRNRKEADEFEVWAKSKFDLCPKCYCQEQREEEKRHGLLVSVVLITSGIMNQSNYDVAFIFSGDTFSYKDMLSIMGAKWTDQYPEGLLADLFLQDRSRKWVLFSSMDEARNYFDEIKRIAKVVKWPTETEMKMYYRCKKEQAQRREKIQADLEQLGEKLSWSEEIEAIWPSKATWNRKFYGRSGSWSIYLSGTKISLTDEKKEKMEEILKKRQEWKEKKEEIERKYR